MVWRATQLLGFHGLPYAEVGTGSLETTQVKSFQASLERLGTLELRGSVEVRRV